MSLQMCRFSLFIMLIFIGEPIGSERKLLNINDSIFKPLLNDRSKIDNTLKLR